MIEVQDILKEAGKLGACTQSAKASDWKSLCWLFFSPQGREFCKANNYPSLEVFRGAKAKLAENKVYVEDNVTIINENVALIKSTGEITYHGVDKAYTVILMHGANALIKAGNYAVVRIENMGGTYNIINDGTARILV